MSPKAPVSFRTPAAWRAWLRVHHADTGELLVRLFKVHAADQGMTYAQALDEALCYGWIDGVRRSLDRDSFTIRFTPRRRGSIWSNVNVRHVERLIAEKRMTRPGLAAYEARTAKKTGVYSFEREAARLSPAMLRKFRANRAAWAWFENQAPWYRRTSTFWVVSAKQEETRERRLEQLIGCSARGTPIAQLRRK